MCPCATGGLGRAILRTPFRLKKLHGYFVGATEPVDQSRSKFHPTNGVKAMDDAVTERVKRSAARSAR